MGIKSVLALHGKWLRDKDGGVRADLCGADLCCADLRNANLRRANLCGADLRDADLSGADLCCAELSDANLCGANLCGADLCCADLRNANLRRADLSGADLRNADLRNANLCGADLRDADLSGADLRDADLSGVKIDECTSFFALQCPEEGAFIGWKKCRGNVIVKLLIPEDAKRSSATSRKCRASKVKVLEVLGAEYGVSQNDVTTIYRVGETVTPDSWNEDRWMECSNGIHFFITRQEAEQYN